MEAAGKQSSSSSFTCDLFGTKDSSSSSQILDSIFAPPAKVSGGEYLHLSENGKKNGTVTQPCAAKTPLIGEKEHNWSKEKSRSNSYFEEEKTTPFHYSSSIYYGGQDVYSQPPSSGVATYINKDVGEDDSDSASRGNWWQGSLYY